MPSLEICHPERSETESSSVNTNAFNNILCFTDTRSIGKTECNSTHINSIFNNISCCTCNFSYNGLFST